MSAVSAYARARAVAAGRAQPIATVRHVYLSARPFALVPLALAGEANAPLAAMVGTAPDDARLLVVTQPRDRQLRFAFAAALADVLLPYLDGFAGATEQVRDRERYLDAPQLLLPNGAGARFLRLFGRSTRFRRTTGDYPVPAQVPVLGRWLTHLAERAEYPGSSTVLAVTDALALHWATGQSPLEDANLAALLAWIAPPAGMSGAEAALLAEDPLRNPPAGPSTDPGFDNEVLAPAVRAYDAAAPGTPERARAVAAVERALREQLEPVWRMLWQGHDLLRSLPEGATVESRWAFDRQDFTDFHTYVAGGGLPQARRDGAVAAARRLTMLELAQNRLEAARALDDPLVMANQRITGEAFLGTVVEVERDRRVPNARGNLVTRPLVAVKTDDPVRVPVGATVLATTRRGQQGVVHSLSDGLVRLELSGGMGRKKVPEPGTVPELGERLCYTSLLPDTVPGVPLPPTEETPWTHGGPPVPYEPTEDDAREGWE